MVALDLCNPTGRACLNRCIMSVYSEVLLQLKPVMSKNLPIPVPVGVMELRGRGCGGEDHCKLSVSSLKIPSGGTGKDRDRAGVDLRLR